MLFHNSLHTFRMFISTLDSLFDRNRREFLNFLTTQIWNFVDFSHSKCQNAPAQLRQNIVKHQSTGAAYPATRIRGETYEHSAEK